MQALARLAKLRGQRLEADRRIDDVAQHRFPRRLIPLEIRVDRFRQRRLAESGIPLRTPVNRLPKLSG